MYLWKRAVQKAKHIKEKLTANTRPSPKGSDWGLLTDVIEEGEELCRSSLPMQAPAVDWDRPEDNDSEGTLCSC